MICIEDYNPKEISGDHVLMTIKNWALVEIADTEKKFYIGHRHKRGSHSDKSYPWYKWFYSYSEKCRSCKAKAPERIITFHRLLRL